MENRNCIEKGEKNEPKHLTPNFQTDHSFSVQTVD